MERYETPGERLVSKVPTKEFKDNYDAIFGKKETWLERREREALPPPKLRGCPNKEGGCFCTGVCMQALEQAAEMQEKEKHDTCTD